ncbi:MAG: XdhC/CoxI family protein [Pseudomonadota bacterium]|nr:XdhC/CoxI family protein [Pseudomonadota bacterium]
MDERLFHQLGQWLGSEPVVLATVIATRGATPRKGGSRMLIAATRSAASVGGGLAESRVIDAARALLERNGDIDQLRIDLSGQPGAAGVCGGSMQIALRRWSGAADRDRAQRIAAALAEGQRVALPASAEGASREESLVPNPRLLIVGAGHCAAALCDLAQFLDYDLWVYDERPGCFDSDSFVAVHRVDGAVVTLRQAFDTQRRMLVVLLNRDFASDVATLRAIAGLPSHFLGMMGSQKRINQVLAALPDQPELASRLHAPVGIDIHAQTPHEIAVSILAQLIQSQSAIR